VLATKHRHPSTKQPEIVGKVFIIFFLSAGDALRKVVLLRWSVGAVGAGSVPGGAVGGARFVDPPADLISALKLRVLGDLEATAV
jgi:hypothetical protein